MNDPDSIDKSRKTNAKLQRAQMVRRIIAALTPLNREDREEVIEQFEIAARIYVKRHCRAVIREEASVS